VTTRPRKPATRPSKPPHGMSVEQRTNALRNSALQASQRAKRQPVDMDWDSCIVRLRAMLDRLED